MRCGPLEIEVVCPRRGILRVGGTGIRTCHQGACFTRAVMGARADTHLSILKSSSSSPLDRTTVNLKCPRYRLPQFWSYQLNDTVIWSRAAGTGMAQ